MAAQTGAKTRTHLEQLYGRDIVFQEIRNCSDNKYTDSSDIAMELHPKFAAISS